MGFSLVKIRSLFLIFFIVQSLNASLYVNVGGSSSWNYENVDKGLGIKTYLKDNGSLVNIASGLLLIPSMPFAGAPYIQDYLTPIQDYRYLVKENKHIKEEAMNNLKDNR